MHILHTLIFYHPTVTMIKVYSFIFSHYWEEVDLINTFVSQGDARRACKFFKYKIDQNQKLQNREFFGVANVIGIKLVNMANVKLVDM